MIGGGGGVINKSEGVFHTRLKSEWRRKGLER